MQQLMPFPSVEHALKEPNGLLAVGGELSVPLLIEAYSRGIFPWYDQTQPVMWWSPDPRAVIYADDFKPSRSLKKSMRRHNYRLSVNKNFAAVVSACAEPRGHDRVDNTSNQTDTWITDDMQSAYLDLHHAGYAHSIEVWNQDKLVGGIYGVGIGPVFSGESMFFRQTDASKIAFAATCRHLSNIGWKLLDCQIPNPHLSSLGVISLPRATFLQQLCPRSAHRTDNSNERRHETVQPSQQLWTALAWNNSRELAESFQ